MFYKANSYNQPLADWDTSRVTSLSEMFSVAYAYNQPLADWDTSRVTSLSQMFSVAYAYNQPVADWDVSNVASFQDMFSYARVFNQPLADWDMSSAQNLARMLTDASKFNQTPWCSPSWAASPFPKNGYTGVIDGRIVCCPNAAYYDAASTNCTSCPSGWVSESGARSCEQCVPGQLSNKPRTECDDCEKGTYGHRPGSCASCKPGTYQDGRGMSDCVKCPPDTYSSLSERTSRADCTACPPDATTDGTTGNSNESSCLCKGGFYQSDTSEACLICPSPGSVCGKPGSTLFTIRAAPGYFRSSNSSLEFIKCHVASDCPGGLFHEQCRHGHTGVLCAVCDRGFVRKGGECSFCDTSNAAVGFASLSIGAALLLMGVLLLTFTRKAKNVREDSGAVKSWIEENARKNLHGELLDMTGDNAGDIVANVGAPESLFTRIRILIGYTQICAALNLAFEIPWPAAFVEFVEGLTFINLSFLDLLAPLNPCALSTSFLTAGVVHMFVLPICACFVLSAHSVATFMKDRWCCWRKNRYSRQDVSSRAKKAMLFLIFLLYPVSVFASVGLLLNQTCKVLTNLTCAHCFSPAYTKYI